MVTDRNGGGAVGASLNCGLSNRTHLRRIKRDAPTTDPQVEEKLPHHRLSHQQPPDAPTRARRERPVA
jgi:hypothetical protein